MKINLGHVLLVLFLTAVLANQFEDILLVSDIHYDILYNSKSDNSRLNRCHNTENFTNNEEDLNDYGRFSCNSNEKLIREVLERMREDNPRPKYIINCGDTVATWLMNYDISKDGKKDINKELYFKSIEKVSELLYEYFPDTDILLNIGDNDFFEGDSHPVGDSKTIQYKHYEKYFFERMYKNNNFKNLQTTVSEGMFYEIKIDNKTKIIAVNSLMFNADNPENYSLDPWIELFWLNKTLSNSQENVILTLHFSPYPNYYDKAIHYMWNQKYLELFEYIIYEHRHKILSLLGAHGHWKLLGARTPLFQNKNPYFKGVILDSYMPYISVPSISPVYDNNPGYMKLKYDSEKGTIHDFIHYFFDLNSTLQEGGLFSKNKELSPIQKDYFWNIQYSLRDDFGFRNFDSNDITDFLINRRRDKNVNELFNTLYAGFRRADTHPEDKEWNAQIVDKNGMFDANNKETLECVRFTLYDSELAQCVNKVQDYIPLN